MRRWILVTAVAVLAVLAFLTAACAVPLCEYRSPVTRLSDLALSFAYQYYNDPFGVPEQDLNQGQFTVEYVALFDQPEYGYDVTIRNDMLISVLDVSTYTTFANGNFKRYFISGQDFFAYAGGSARSSSEFQTLGLSVDAGVGCGRFVDVTPLARATRIDNYLVDRGTLSEHLHPLDLRILADEIGSRAKYDSTAALLAAIQDVIEGSGYIRLGGLDALDISEITQLIQSEGFSRYCGWDLKFGLGFELIDPSGESNDLLLTGSFNYAFATTPNEQFLIQGSFLGPPTIFQENRVDLKVGYDYLFSDLLSLAASYEFSRETWVSLPTDLHRISLEATLEPLDTALITFGVTFENRPYYTEWSVDLKLSIGIELL